MISVPRTLVAILALAIATPAFAAHSHDEAPTVLDCDVMPCAEVLPTAVRFEANLELPYWTGYAADGEEAGWVVLSTSILDIPAYSGKPLATLVALDPDGVISGAQVVHHSEPILLTGIPESALTDFVDFYPGRRAVEHIVVGRPSNPEAIGVDVISGATVTALAQNQTILRSARAVGAMVGVVNLAEASPGHFVEDQADWTWQQMVDNDVWGRLTVSNAEMGDDRPGAFVDLHYAIIDSPFLGRPLLGPGLYEHLYEQLERGQHLFAILGNGSNSFKGSAFVRGGIFDRVRIQQGFTEVLFRDTDYRNLSSPRLPGAPTWNEGAVFITRGGFLDPGRTYDMVFLGSRYDGVGGFSREFHEFSSSHRTPASIYVVDGPDPEEAMYVQAWRNQHVNAVLLITYLLFVIGVFAARKYTTADPKRIQRLHKFSMLTGLVLVGFVLHAQPSITQMLTLAASAVGEWRWDLFASEPLIFIMWIFIAVVSVWWGRGVFCGWVCPYGALSEFIFIISKKLGIKEFELSDRVHMKLRNLRYVVLIALVPIFLWNSVLGEQLAEIEPFKSTFFVPLWTREWWFIAWWMALALWSVFTFRPFCRYLCPLGGGLALFNSFRPAGPRRRSFCTNCNICTRGCEPRAIRPDGTIDARECLSCMDCEANYRDETVCPPLIGIEKLIEKRRVERLSERDEARLVKLGKDAADV